MEELKDLASRRYAVFSLAQAKACGISEHAVGRAVRGGTCRRLHAGVFAFAGSPESWEQSVLAACLAAGQGAVASHRSAARIWKLIDPSDDTLPVTNPLRTIVDLAAVLPADEVEDAIDAGLAWPSLFSIAAIEAMRIDLARRGRRGAGILGSILAERALGDAVSDSKLESRMAGLLRKAELPPAVFHYVVTTPEGVFLAEVDFAYPKVVREPQMVGRAIAGALAGLAAA